MSSSFFLSFSSPLICLSRSICLGLMLGYRMLCSSSFCLRFSRLRLLLAFLFFFFLSFFSFLSFFLVLLLFDFFFFLSLWLVAESDLEIDERLLSRFLLLFLLFDTARDALLLSSILLLWWTTSSSSFFKTFISFDAMLVTL